MTHRLAILTLASLSMLAFGCSKGPGERLSGKWTGESIDNIPPSQQERATGWVRSTSLEFRGDKLTVAVPAEEPRTGTFRVARTSGNRLTVHIERPDGQRDETTFTVTGEGTMKWDIGNERSIRLVRVAAR